MDMRLPGLRAVVCYVDDVRPMLIAPPILQSVYLHERLAECHRNVRCGS